MRYLYTTAPVAYDYPSVKTLGIVGKLNKEFIRRVEVVDETRAVGYQIPRYCSGLYSVWTETQIREAGRTQEGVELDTGEFMVRCSKCGVFCLDPEEYPRCEADNYFRCCQCGAHHTNEGIEAHPCDRDRRVILDRRVDAEAAGRNPGDPDRRQQDRRRAPLGRKPTAS